LHAGWLRSAEDIFSHCDGSLEANVAVLHWENRRLLFVSVDLLYSESLLAHDIEELAAQHGIPPEEVLLTASHTHSVPPPKEARPIKLLFG